MYDMMNISPIMSELEPLFKILYSGCMKIHDEIRVYASDGSKNDSGTGISMCSGIRDENYYGITYYPLDISVGRTQVFFHPIKNVPASARDRVKYYDQIHQMITDFIKASRRNDKISEVLNA